MSKPKYPKDAVERTAELEKQVKAVDNLIKSSRLLVNMLQGTAAMDSYLWNYYSQSEAMMHGFCLMLRTWINFHRSWKKGELLRLIEEGKYNDLTANELKEYTETAKLPAYMAGFFPPTLLRRDKLSDEYGEEQKKRYLEEYVNSRYCLWPNAAPIHVACISTQGKVIVTLEQTEVPLSMHYTIHE